MDDDFDFGDLEALTAMMSKFEKPTESAQIVHTPARQPQQELIEIEDEEEEQVAPSVPLGAEANLGAEAAAARAQIRTGHARDFLAGVRAAVQTRTGSTFSPIAGVRMRPLDFEKSSGVTGGGPHSALDAVVSAPIHRKHVLVYDGAKLVQPDPVQAAWWEFPLTGGFQPREYQVAIVRRALFENTLVSLPTGLGKTFISAVVMANYFRWFPTGQIVFLAPTKPLVTQQVQACHDSAGIPASATAQLLGNVKPSVRAQLWAQRRLFFCTPQSFSNDLASGAIDPHRIVLIVFDEAHRASGGYAYCTAIQELDKHNRRYRVLALSATPGTDLSKVQDVITQLHIAHIEVRGDDDPDVQKYTFDKTIHEVTVPLSRELTEIRDTFLHVMKSIVDRLVSMKVIPPRDPDKVPGVLLLQWKQELARCRPPGMSGDGFHQANGMLNVLISLSNALRTLTNMGSVGFHNALTEIQKTANRDPIRASVVKMRSWIALMDRLAALHSSGRTLIHPKILKLVEVLRDHFGRFSAAGGSRCIVFTHARATVDEILTHLRPLEPMCKASPFVGQAGPKAGASAKKKGVGKAAASLFEQSTRGNDGDEDEDEDVEVYDEFLDGADDSGKVSTLASKGQTQKQQQEVIDAFRKGSVNVLVATCIGEEGLDIGSVDLVVFYDSVASPIRMMQRLGRTGRKRSGSCVCLCTAGSEVQKFRRAMSRHRQISSCLKRDMASFQMYRGNPAMVWMPGAMAPEPRFTELTVGEFHASQLAGRAVGKDEKRKLKEKSKAVTDWGITDSQRAFLTDACDGFETRLLGPGEGADRHFGVDLSKWSGFQSESSVSCLVGHSSASRLLVTVLKASALMVVEDFDDEQFTAQYELGEELESGAGFALMEPNLAGDEGDDVARGGTSPALVNRHLSDSVPIPVVYDSGDDDFVDLPFRSRRDFTDAEDVSHGEGFVPPDHHRDDVDERPAPLPLVPSQQQHTSVSAPKPVSQSMSPPSSSPVLAALQSADALLLEGLVPCLQRLAASQARVMCAPQASRPHLPSSWADWSKPQPSLPISSMYPSAGTPALPESSPDHEEAVHPPPAAPELPAPYHDDPSATTRPDAPVVVQTPQPFVSSPPLARHESPAKPISASGCCFESTPTSIQPSFLSPVSSLPEVAVRSEAGGRRVLRKKQKRRKVTRTATPSSSPSPSPASPAPAATKPKAVARKANPSLNKYIDMDAEVSGSDSGDEDDEDDEVLGSLEDFIDDESDISASQAGEEDESAAGDNQPRKRTSRLLMSLESQEDRAGFLGRNPRRSSTCPMPFLSRLVQAMKDGVTADDLAEDEEEDIIEVEGEDDESEEDDEPDHGISGDFEEAEESRGRDDDEDDFE